MWLHDRQSFQLTLRSTRPVGQVSDQCGEAEEHCDYRCGCRRLQNNSLIFVSSLTKHQQQTCLPQSSFSKQWTTCASMASRTRSALLSRARVVPVAILQYVLSPCGRIECFLATTSTQSHTNDLMPGLPQTTPSKPPPHQDAHVRLAFRTSRIARVVDSTRSQ